MGSYRVLVQPKAARQLKKLTPQLQRKIVPIIEALAENPRPEGCKKLSGRLQQWRVRVGDYRIMYTIRNAELVILIIEVARRDQVYRRK